METSKDAHYVTVDLKKKMWAHFGTRNKPRRFYELFGIDMIDSSI